MPSCFLYECIMWHCAFVLMKSEYERHISQRTRIQTKKHERTLHRGHRLCSVEICHTQIGPCFQLHFCYYDLNATILHLCIKWRAHVWLFTLFVQFRAFSSLLGGINTSIALLDEQYSFSCVFTPYSFICICIRHMIGNIGGKWPTAMIWLSIWLKRQYTDKRYSVYITSTMTLKLVFTGHYTVKCVFI